MALRSSIMVTRMLANSDLDWTTINTMIETKKIKLTASKANSTDSVDNNEAGADEDGGWGGGAGEEKIVQRLGIRVKKGEPSDSSSTISASF